MPTLALPSAPGIARRSWWSRGFGTIRAQLAQGLTSHHLALAIALGAACAFFPVLGLATPLCLLVGAVLRLNHPVIQAINALTAPIYPIVVLGCIQLGERMASIPSGTRCPARLAHLGSAIASGSFSFGLVAEISSLAGHAVLGWLAATAVAAPLVYLLCRLASGRFLRPAVAQRLPP